MDDIERSLARLYKSWSGHEPISITKLPGSGSYRSYYRLAATDETVIGAYNGDIIENKAFIKFTEHFRREGIPVPEVLADDPKNCVYLLTDLGDMTLYQLLCDRRDHQVGDQGSLIPGEVLEIYRKAIRWLPVIQVKAGRTLDYGYCYPRAAFDRQSMMWDLNYFKYYFLKLAKIPFDEQALENDFTGFCDLLVQADSEFFLFRDFQSRNIMVVDGEPWFIDYQGGRKGALQYDIASLLIDGKANLPEEVRTELLHYYLDELEKVFPVDRHKFLDIYHGFVLVRILQALGAYGFRGYYEGKTHFLQSIPYALKNLRHLRETNLIGFGLSTLMTVIDNMVNKPELYYKQFIKINDVIVHNINEINNINIVAKPDQNLAVTVCSFSYKKSVPMDKSGHGGGFVFDCRALPNPGRYEAYRQFSGKDQPVIDFLSMEPEVGEFLRTVSSLVDQSVNIYTGRGFNHLMVSFGCTGGQHRSVYCAEELAKHLRDKFKIAVEVVHYEQRLHK